MSKTRLVLGGAAVLLLALLAALAAYQYRKQEQLDPSALRLLKPVDRSQSPEDQIRLIPLFPTETGAAPVLKGNFWASPQLVMLHGRSPFMLLPASSGTVAAVDLPGGKRLWQTQLGQPSVEEVFARTAPGQFGENVMVVYQATNRTTGAVENRAEILDLRSGKPNSRFPRLIFDARVPTIGGGEAKFEPSLHMARAVSIISSPQGAGRAYVTFSGTDESQGWHGWLFEVDLDRWRLGFANRAISAVFVPTPEAECDGEPTGKICGGGMWAYAGPIIQPGRAGPEILVQTGNGRLDLSRNDYSESLLRLVPGLKFAPQCDARVCAQTNPRDPAPSCLATCRNLFVPRLLPGDPPVNTPDGRCNGKSYIECLEQVDWDFGSSSPARMVAEGHPYFVVTGKAGDVYLIDGNVLGIMYDRKQAAAQCGSRASPCPAPFAGWTITEPAVTAIDGSPLVVIATFNVDTINPAGAVAYRIVGAPGAPRLEEAWRFPNPGLPEAVKWFRAPPTRPVISEVNHEPVVWLADNAANGHLVGIRVRDGKVLADIKTAGWPMRNSKPVILNDIIYLPSAVQGRPRFTWIEAYRIAAPR